MYDGYEVYFIDEGITVGPICYLVKDGKVSPCIGKKFHEVLRYFNNLHPEEEDEEEIDYEDEQIE